MNLTDPVHKKVIGIIFIIFSAFGLLSILFYDQFMDFIIRMAAQDGDMPPEAAWIFDFISSLLWGIALIFFIPRIIIGIGLVNQRKWAEVPALVYGIISLINIPIGTLLGVYCILVLTAKKRAEEDY
ncbi:MULTISPECIES: hypothetical protein [Roseivirga]|jgi:hypothetical protein|uniref:hypothetical protein n=1 Tax=Roseivirga TaxID=290180 RepID=UPI0025811D09|nr:MULTISPECIES: hypothetical protein [Roseivirga]MEC7756083.1 hypothetical protein [Bacteroidota bacterium]|tara:strand:+ start:7406 stop:7786 length:381 start_codon:yes stop_codon:yes gene_type:complete